MRDRAKEAAAACKVVSKLTRTIKKPELLKDTREGFDHWAGPPVVAKGDTEPKNVKNAEHDCAKTHPDMTHEMWSEVEKKKKQEKKASAQRCLELGRGGYLAKSAATGGVAGAPAQSGATPRVYLNPDTVAPARRGTPPMVKELPKTKPDLRVDPKSRAGRALAPSTVANDAIRTVDQARSKLRNRRRAISTTTGGGIDTAGFQPAYPGHGFPGATPPPGFGTSGPYAFDPNNPAHGSQNPLNPNASNPALNPNYLQQNTGPLPGMKNKRPRTASQFSSGKPGASAIELAEPGSSTRSVRAANRRNARLLEEEGKLKRRKKSRKRKSKKKKKKSVYEGVNSKMASAARNDNLLQYANVLLEKQSAPRAAGESSPYDKYDDHPDRAIREGARTSRERRKAWNEPGSDRRTAYDSFGEEVTLAPGQTSADVMGGAGSPGTLAEDPRRLFEREANQPGYLKGNRRADIEERFPGLLAAAEKAHWDNRRGGGRSPAQHWRAYNSTRNYSPTGRVIPGLSLIHI